MTKILFEDSPDVELSKFIKQAYNTEVLFFSGGGRSLRSKLQSIWKQEDLIVVYVDVVPDNEKTINTYNNVVSYIKEHNWDNVEAIPIPCIEYYVIKTLWNFQEDFVKVAIDRGAYKSTELFKKHTGITSFERFCKLIVTQTGQSCKQIKTKDIYAKGKGRYYITDCVCSVTGTNEGHLSKRLQDKARDLMRSLPLYIPFDQNEVTALSITDSNALHAYAKERRKEFLKWKEKYRRYGYYTG